MIDLVKFTSAPATGSDGAAATTAFAPQVSGRIIAVTVQYNGSPPATADISLTDEENPAEDAIIFKTNNNTDFHWYPRRPVQNNAGADLTYDGSRKIHEPYVVHGRLKCVLSQANNGDSITIIVWMER